MQKAINFILLQKFSIIMVYKYDFLIIGAGVAGMSYALKIARAHKGKVASFARPHSTRQTPSSHKVAWQVSPTLRLTTLISTSKTP